MCAHSAMILNRMSCQSLGGQHCIVFTGCLKRWVFRRHLKMSVVGENLTLRGNLFRTVEAK